MNTVEVAEESSVCESSIVEPPWSGAFWSGVGLFACYWVLFGVLVGGGGWGEQGGVGGVGGGEGYERGVGLRRGREGKGVLGCCS